MDNGKCSIYHPRESPLRNKQVVPEEMCNLAKIATQAELSFGEREVAINKDPEGS